MVKVAAILGFISLLWAMPLQFSTEAPAKQLPARKPTSVSPANIQVYFSPRGGCTEAIIREINSAQRSIHIQAYSFTSAPIARALLDAHRRKIQINAILDKSNRTDKYSSATFLHNQGIQPLIDDNHAIAHNKIIIIDEARVITGSFNFSKAAEERNAENVLIINEPVIAKQYLQNWRAHLAHSEKFEPIRK